jgi:hypothetical protein
MAAGTTLAQKSLPGWKDKGANSKNLNRAFKKIIGENLEKSRLARFYIDLAPNQRDRDHFSMSPGLCRT